jgi:SAM-dependent methyltransferase
MLSAEIRMKPCSEPLSCPACHKRHLFCVGPIPPDNQFAGRTLDYMIPGGHLYRCDTCALLFRWPRLSKEELDDLYRTGTFDNWVYNPENRRDWQAAKKWLNENCDGGKILDVGCWDGGFLNYLDASWQRYGIEINSEASSEAEKKGISLVSTDFSHMDNVSITFDAVVAFDVVEHMENPQRLLEQLTALTRTDGYIVISSGNTDAASWKFMGSRYWYCTIPEHISFINARWCKNAAEACGLEIVYSVEFSHRPADCRKLAVVEEIAKNILYRCSPGFVGALRSLGFGGLDVKKSRELRLQPPGWMSAKDHLLVLFRKR